MPVAQTRGHAGKALLIAGVSVVLLIIVAFLVAIAGSRGDVDVRLGDDRFEGIDASNQADRIEKDGGLPVLYQDLVGRGRDIFLQHTTTDPNTGWLAFAAADPDRPDCPVQIDRTAKILFSDCGGRRTFPLDGTGLRAYPVTVVDGRLVVDINELSTTTTSSTTTTTPTSSTDPTTSTTVPVG